MGLIIGILIFILRHLHLAWLLVTVPPITEFQTWIHIFIQIHLTTGLFITAHDAIHGTVSHGKPKINAIIGWIMSLSYAFFPYGKLKSNHFEHHKFPGSEKDPDYSIGSQKFLIWWLRFMWHYASIIQLIGFAISFNILKVWIQPQNIWYFWFLPTIISSIQLFFFGTYLPHKLPHNQLDPRHNSRTQNKNHLWAFITCYFFGYHWEHHQFPQTPWWRLYQKKS